MLLNAFLHWLHLLAAISWAGGMIFTSLVLGPILRQKMAPNARMPLYQEVGRKFKTLQLHSLIILLATGGHKLWRLTRGGDLFSSGMGTVLEIKLALVAVVLVLTYLHTYRWGPALTAMAGQEQNPAFRGLSQKMAFWGRANLALVILIILASALLHFPPL
ncbi:MAG: DUF4149 domain-containing protein [Elusimicrobia bacterium]|nr:DUF4149 domain-containing protein [Elusimicrobiota bacterium]